MVRWPLTRWCLVLGWVAAAAIARGEEGTPPPETPIGVVVDHYVQQQLTAAGVAPANRADDATLLRRTTLDLVGRPPTLAEVRDYLSDTSADKRDRWIARCLESPEFRRHQIDEFERLLTRGQGGNLREYLTKAFEERRPWDAIFRDLVLAETPPTAEFLRPRVGDLDKLANDASILFFGINISCAQCHDHPHVSEWTQDRFYGMKSFFSRTFENGGLLGERAYGVVDYQTQGGEQRRASLMFLSGRLVEEPAAEEPNDEQKKEERKLLEQLREKKEAPPRPAFSRRAQLVEVALSAEERQFFARAMVNRLWARYHGRGLVHPLDQLHPENPPSHPELLEWLARDFIEHGYDLRRLIAGLVSSECYARSSLWEGDAPPPELFAVAAVRPLTPPQYAATLRFAAADPEQLGGDTPADEIARRVTQLRDASRGLAGQFEWPEDNFQVGADEALALSNNPRFAQELLRDGDDMLVGRLKKLETDAARVELAIWATCGRAPADGERELLESYLAERTDRPLEALQQLTWALLASGELRFAY